LPEEEKLPAGIDGHVLAKEQLLIVAPRSWRSASATVREIAEAGWILNPEGCAARAWLQRELARAGRPLRVGVEAYNYDLQMSLVARGRGLGLVPKRLLAASPVRKQLRTLSVRSLEFPMTIWTVTRDLAAGLKSPLDSLNRGLARRLAARAAPSATRE
jgi:DNA-binding transcriptional LysR family regulator